MKILLTFICIITLVSCSVKPKPVNIQSIKDIYPKDWYSGYLDFPFQEYKAHMHYFYFPSQSDPENDPLLFWFNGGPGCSSLLGALYEHGPFIFIDAFHSLVANPEAWNKRANTVYIESPAQVGFSYLDIDQKKNQTNPKWNDSMTSKLNLASVLQFFNVYSDLKKRPTFLSGQSYAGIYVPTLAYEIHNYNKKAPISEQINLKGFAVGNGCTDESQCEFLSDYPHYQYQLFNDLGILPNQLFEQVEDLCKQTPLTDACQAMIKHIDEQLVPGINIYDAYRPCWQNKENKTMAFSKMLKKVHRISSGSQENDEDETPPCVDSEGLVQLLTNDANRAALNIPSSVIKYAMCAPDAYFSYDRSLTGSLYVYEALVPLNQYRIVKYSGDSDPAVPFSGTIKWVNKLREQLRLPTTTYWKPWETQTANGFQNSGSIWQLGNKFTLFRFKGVGHMAPQWNNLGGTKLINYLLFGEKPWPKTSEL